MFGIGSRTKLSTKVRLLVYRGANVCTYNSIINYVII